MSLFQSFILSIIQGITEFLPVSSSAHLILTSKLLQMPQQGLFIDVMLHLGTLGAVLVYFRKEIGQLVVSALKMLRGQFDEQSNLVFSLVLATLPVVLFGLVLTSSAYDFRGTHILIVNLIVFGALMYCADRLRPTEKSFRDISMRDAFFIGLFQALALLPGVSRSGACLTAARLLRIKRADGARYAMILSIPAIVAATAKTTFDAYKEGVMIIDINTSVAMLLTFVVGYLCIGWFMKWLGRFSLAPFAYYRIFLGVLLWFIL